MKRLLPLGAVLAVLIGAPQDETGGMDTGAAYLFSIPPPLLRILLTSTNSAAISWLSPATGFTLQQNASGIAAENWSNVVDSIQHDGTNFTFLVSPLTGSKFYRLWRQ